MDIVSLHHYTHFCQDNNAQKQLCQKTIACHNHQVENHKAQRTERGTDEKAEASCGKARK